MGRWADLDSDAERLPEGMQRIAYDAEDLVYTFRDADGSLWEGAPGNRYGRLHRVEEASPLPSWSSSPTSADLEGLIGTGGSSHYTISSASSSSPPSSSRVRRRGGSMPSASVSASVASDGRVRRSLTARESRRQARTDKDVEAFLSGGPPPPSNPMASAPRRSNTVSRLVGLIRRRSSATGGTAGQLSAITRSGISNNNNNRSGSGSSNDSSNGSSGSGNSSISNGREASSVPRPIEPYSPTSLSRQASTASSQTAWSLDEKNDATAVYGLGQQESRLSRASTLYGEREDRPVHHHAGGARPRRATTFDEILTRI